MRVVLNGWQIKSEADFHRAIAKQLDFPAYYGANLDALWDCISRDVVRPVHLVWENSLASDRAIGDGFQRITKVLNDAAKEDERFGPEVRFSFELA